MKVSAAVPRQQDDGTTGPEFSFCRAIMRVILIGVVGLILQNNEVDMKFDILMFIFMCRFMFIFMFMCAFEWISWTCIF